MPFYPNTMNKKLKIIIASSLAFLATIFPQKISLDIFCNVNLKVCSPKKKIKALFYQPFFCKKIFENWSENFMIRLI